MENIGMFVSKRKYNIIKKMACLDERTFTEIFGFLERRIYMDMDTYTAKQIADIMQLCYEQHFDGYYQCAHENGINNDKKTGSPKAPCKTTR